MNLRVPRPLSILLLTLTVVLLGLSLRFGLPIYRQHLAVQEILRLGGSVHITVEGPGGLPQRLPDCLKDLLGSVRAVNLGNCTVDDVEILNLEPQTNLRQLSLNDTQVSDSGLVTLGRISSLRELDLSRTQITDVGLRRIEDLKRLRKLYLHQTVVSRAYIGELVQKRPGLEVYANGDVYK